MNALFTAKGRYTNLSAEFGGATKRAPVRMDKNIYKFIFKHTKGQQIYILLVTVCSMPFYYASLDIPKLIINSALRVDDPAVVGDEFPRPLTILGIEIMDMEQLTLLGALCVIFLFLVLVNGGFKMYINIYKGRMGERMLRRLRYLLYSRILRFPLAHFRKVSQGELIPMITAEVEPLGGFIGDAFAVPALQGGLLLTAIFYIFSQDPMMGVASILLYPIQGYIIPRLQKKVNLLGKARVREVRKLSEKIGESVSGIQEIHGNDTAQYELADFSQRLGTIFTIRFQIYNKKFFIKFLNNLLAQLTPFFFFSIGGYLVINGEISLGALVAVLLRDARNALLTRVAFCVQLVTSCVIVASYLATFVIAARAIGSTTPITILVPLIPLVLLTMLVPVSIAGWGVREGAAALLWAAAGLSATEGAAISATYGLLVLLSSLPGGLILLSVLRHRQPV